MGTKNTDIREKIDKFNMLYFTLIVEHDINCLSCKEVQVSLAVAPKNAFALMMNSARKQADDDIPKKHEHPKNEKEKLYNAATVFLKESDCPFPRNISQVGKMFVERFVNLLWYIDGHIATIERESTQRFLNCLKNFQGFNCPEKCKHQKRSIGNLSSNMLETHCIALKEIWQGMSFAENECWSKEKLSILHAIQVREDYVEHLKTKNFMQLHEVILKMLPMCLFFQPITKMYTTNCRS